MGSSPVFEVTYDKDSETWLFKTSTILKSMELKFKLGEEFDEKAPDGREVRAIVTKEATLSSQSRPQRRKAKRAPRLLENSKETKSPNPANVLAQTLSASRPSNAKAH